MIVLSEARASGDDLAGPPGVVAFTRAALGLGLVVFFLPPEAHRYGAADALANLPTSLWPQDALWFGTMPHPQWYEQVFQEAAGRGLTLINTPHQHAVAQELHRSYPLLSGMTPETTFVTGPEDAVAAAERIGLPVFMRGTARSRKHFGQSACVAETAIQVRRIAVELLRSSARSRGIVAVREYVPLRGSCLAARSISEGREFRVTLYRGEVLACGEYWLARASDSLNREEAPVVFDLCRRAAHRLATPLVNVDVAQAQDGSWLVIEAGDPQFNSPVGARLTPLLASLVSSDERYKPTAPR